MSRSFIKALTFCLLETCDGRELGSLSLSEENGRGLEIFWIGVKVNGLDPLINGEDDHSHKTWTVAPLPQFLPTSINHPSV
ncbi:unnamed protein product [Cuscuta campestris]|uniref:Uncharacterized protein n=1 Tax=Cuscuta campestris TaxID=132261 RepID=A0A484MMY6_9ASTE|nr:unnamed protein product [Cuscuta campestris]